MSSTEAAVRLILTQRNRTPWVYRAERYWCGWRTLIPVSVGHDEYARRTILLGWTFVGRIVFPLWGCGDEECIQDAMQQIREEAS